MTGNSQHGPSDLRIEDCSKQVMERVIDSHFRCLEVQGSWFFQLVGLVHQFGKLMLMLKDYLRKKIALDITSSAWPTGRKKSKESVSPLATWFLDSILGEFKIG